MIYTVPVTSWSKFCRIFTFWIKSKYHKNRSYILSIIDSNIIL